MSGLEGAALAGGGRLLGGLAAPAARALVHKATFRWRVWWRVRKRIDYSSRRKTWPHCNVLPRVYRKWLKTITAEELANPVENIQAPLAKRLDEDLSYASEDWGSADDHLSRALRLVELTYPAIAAALGDGDRAELSEKWAQQRNAGVRNCLLQLVGPGAALSSDDLAAVLQQRSKARRTVRLQVFEIDEATLASYFDQIEVLDVQAGGVAVLEGDFGSGKSETAETWHRAEIKNLVAGDNAPFPVWLGARELLGQTLESTIEQQLGPTWRHGRGASVAVDGVDETDPATAQTLLETARTLARTYTNVRILLTARPGILSPTEGEKITTALLSENEALELVELASGNSHYTWRWTADMRATVTRPFFALAAGVMLGRDEAPRGEADLIRGLVENALAKGTERSVVTSGETRAVLEKLAVTLTSGGADGLSFSDRQIARSSRLVADGPDRSVAFSLPIFQHWFAAQAILASDVPATEVVTDALGFNRWRWAAAVALLSAPSTEAVDDLLGTWVAGNPGVAAWIINEAFHGHRDWRTEDDEDLDAKTSGARLLRALRTWTDALGPLADGVLPSRVVQGPVGLGVTVSGPRINVALSTSHPPADYVTEVPPGVHPLIPVPVPDWQSWISGGAPQGNAWPWTMVQKRIAATTLNKLSNDPFLGAPNGIWIQERRFDLAQRLLGRSSSSHSPLPAEAVKERAAETFNTVYRNRDARISLGGSTYSGAELEDLVSWLDAAAPGEMVSQLPEEDIPHPARGLVWNFYSPRRLMEFEVEVYGRACEAYDEALGHSFARLGWSMPNSALAPFGVLLEMRYDNIPEFGETPGLTVIQVPMALMDDIVTSRPESICSISRRAVITQPNRDQATDREHRSEILKTIRSWLASQNREPLGGLGWTHTGADDMANVRPASSVAAQWLWDDLKSVGLGTGTFPQLR